MLQKLKLDVAVLDMGDAWEVMRRDGQELTPAELRAFHLYRAGYRIMNPDA
jgi:tRNA A58 N-methylase Trm61